MRKKEKEGFIRRDFHIFSQRKTKPPSYATSTTSLNQNNNDKIYWLIKKDEPVRVAKCTVSRVVDSVHPRRVWADEIVFSSTDKNDLPTHRPSKRSADGTKPPYTIALLESNLRDLPRDKAPFPFDSSDSEEGSPSPSPHIDKSGNKSKYNGNNGKTTDKPQSKPRGRSAWTFFQPKPTAPAPAPAPSQPNQVLIDYEITVSVGPEGLDFKSWVLSNKRTIGKAGKAGGDTVREPDDTDSEVYVGEDGSKENGNERKINVGKRFIPLNLGIFPNSEESGEEEEEDDDDEGVYKERL